MKLPFKRPHASATVFRTFLACLIASQFTTVLANPEVEIMHWWSRGGDHTAMQVFKNEFERRGGLWEDATNLNSIDTLNSAVSRMSKGYSPTFVQWNSGWEVRQISQLGLLDPVTDQKQKRQLRNVILDSILDIVAVDGQIVAIPVNVHSENWLWYLHDRIDEKTSRSFDTWQQFLNFAKTRKEAGETAIAVGTEPWQQRILFNNVLLGVAGRSLYRRIYSNMDISATEDPAFREALETFKKLRQYSRSFGEGHWDEQIAAVAKGEALTVSMGDWAKGEFRNLGIKAGSELACVPAPSTRNKLILVLDVFVRGRVESEQERQGQALFLDVVTDPEVNQRFNLLKGSLPPLKNLDASSLDICGRIAYKALQDQNQLIEPYASHGHREYLSRIDYIINSLWEQKINVSDSITALRDLLIEESAVRLSDSD